MSPRRRSYGLTYQMLTEALKGNMYMYLPTCVYMYV